MSGNGLEPNRSNAPSGMKQSFNDLLFNKNNVKATKDLLFSSATNPYMNKVKGTLPINTYKFTDSAQIGPAELPAPSKPILMVDNEHLLLDTDYSVIDKSIFVRNSDEYLNNDASFLNFKDVMTDASLGDIKNVRKWGNTFYSRLK